MARFKASAVIAIVLVVAACKQPAAPGSPVGTGLTGTQRESFVNRSVSSCIRAAQANPRNAQRSAAAIQQECSCYANKMADSISPAEDQSLNSDDAARIREVLGPRIEAAAAACKPANM